MTSYIFVGRLDKEKGIDTLINAFLSHQKKYKDDILHICGIWQYTEIVKKESDNSPCIVYHGRAWKSNIKALIQKCDYMVMPSIFLETFGLTALESLMLNTPVIGNKKWWCEPFIHPLLHIHTDDKKEAIKDLMRLFDKISEGEIEKISFHDRIHTIQKSYTTIAWSEKVSLYHIHKDIVLMSDYSNKKLGGIEIHLDTIQTQLQNMGHTIHVWQGWWMQWPRGKIQRIWHMLLSIYNIMPRLWLRQHIQKNNITIRYHSILRHIWRYTLYKVSAIKDTARIWHDWWKEKVQTLITYHDFGLFHPFPHRLMQIEQLPIAWSLWWWIKAADTSNPLIIMAVIYKYILISLIHKHLRQGIDIHIVPSLCVCEAVRKRHPDAHCIVLPHFVDIER